MAPGAVILFRKKLEPTSRRMYMPDPVISSTAWCDPIPPESLKRIIPAKSAAWFAGETQRVFGVASPSGWTASDRPEPVMSNRRWFQLISSDATHVCIAIWDDRATAENLHPDSGTVLKAELVPVPKDVRHDLQDVGFVLPPERVLFADISVPPATHTLKLTWHTPGQAIGWSGGQDEIQLPAPQP